jgi:hypothetical protein
MSILKDRINENQDFIEGLGEIWDYFFSTILPALDCILFRVKVLKIKALKIKFSINVITP